MSMRFIESQILQSLKKEEKNSKIKLKDIAWALGDKLPEGYIRPGDKVVHLTILEGSQKVVVAYAPKVKQ